MEANPPASRYHPLFLLIAGLPGSGKTTLARALAQRLRLPHLNTDLVRIELGLEGQYDADSKQRVYDALLQRAEALLSGGKGLVVDSTFYRRAIRKPFQSLAGRYPCRVVWIVVEAAEEVIQQRMQQKRLYSEADFTVYQKLSRESEPLEKPHLALRSDQIDLDEMVLRSIEYLQKETA